MPIHILSTGIGNIVPSQYYLPLAVGLIGATFLRAWASGPSNTRERDLHGRTIIVTGAFTPVGLSIINRLAQSGAQVIALTSSLSDPLPLYLVPAIRATASNELVFAEECDLTSPMSIRAFCTKFIRTTAGTGAKSEPPRLDGIVFAHEYHHIGGLGVSRHIKEQEQGERHEGSLATFLMTTLLLPFILRSPSDRDIRIINLVNPLYSAALPTYIPTTKETDNTPPTSSSISRLEGHRSLRSILLARHLQRVLDALASSGVVPKPDGNGQAVLPKKSSHIVSIAVSPGFSRTATFEPLLRPRNTGKYTSILGSLLYFMIFPILLLLAKSASAASQTALYVLYLPSLHKTVEKGDQAVEGGRLYRDCALVSLPGKGDMVLGDEGIGRAVWEEFERGVEKWEKEWKEQHEENKATPEAHSSFDTGGKGKAKAS